MAGLDPISNVADAAARIIALFKANPNIKVEGQVDLEKTALVGELQGILAQIAVNQEEAKSTSWFVAGWRPFVGWVCGCGFAYAIVLQPFATFVAVMVHNQFDPKQLPTLDVGTILTLLGGMLGLSGMRTYEKAQNVEGNR